MQGRGPTLCTIALDPPNILCWNLLLTCIHSNFLSVDYQGIIFYFLVLFCLGGAQLVLLWDFSWLCCQGSGNYIWCWALNQAQLHAFKHLTPIPLQPPFFIFSKSYPEPMMLRAQTAPGIEVRDSLMPEMNYFPGPWFYYKKQYEHIVFENYSFWEVWILFIKSPNAYWFL